MKLTLTQDEIENFCIDIVNKYEGCPEALIYLKRLYGDQVSDLRTTKQDFVNLAHAGKGHWILNFMLNMVSIKDRVEFAWNIFERELTAVNPTHGDDMLKLLGHMKKAAQKKRYAKKGSEDLISRLNAAQEQNTKILKGQAQGALPNQEHLSTFRRHAEQWQIQAVLLFTEEATKEEPTFTRVLVECFNLLGRAAFYKGMIYQASNMEVSSPTTEAEFMKYIALKFIDDIGLWTEDTSKKKHNTPDVKKMTHK